VRGDLEHAERVNLKEYTEKLTVTDPILPDPFSIKEGWNNESDMNLWPSIYFYDIAEYLKMKTPSELYNKLCNEYKQGKAFR
jgi:hypothetical protein